MIDTCFTGEPKVALDYPRLPYDPKRVGRELRASLASSQDELTMHVERLAATLRFLSGQSATATIEAFDPLQQLKNVRTHILPTVGGREFCVIARISGHDVDQDVILVALSNDEVR